MSKFNFSDPLSGGKIANPSRTFTLNLSDAHPPGPAPTREIEAQVIPVELSGTLTLQDHPGSAVISETQAKGTQRRVEQTNAKIEALLAAKGKVGGRSQNGTRAA